MPEKRIAPTLSSYEEINTSLAGFLKPNRTVALLLDYDGTLAPLTGDPNTTAMPPELEETLKKLARHPRVFMAVISGRGLEDVKKTVGIPGITYAGNHGIEIEFPDGSRHDYELPEEIKVCYRKLVTEMQEKLYRNNAWIEDKKISLTYHYRDTPRDLVPGYKELATQIIEKHGFQANQAHEAIEAKPPVNWNKGEAAILILRQNFGDDFAKRANVIFAGDDTTDEDAMRILQGTGRTFRIAENASIQTFADFRLPRQSLMTDLIKWVAETYKSEN